jgi:NAD(P)-dependent dehydrogenase (short-subunit alcohol dehydrogenase family)
MAGSNHDFGNLFHSQKTGPGPAGSFDILHDDAHLHHALLLERDLRQLVEVNFLGNIFCLQKTAAELAERQGKVVFISSLGSRFYHPEYPLGWMKAAMENVVKSWSESPAARRVNVNAVCAGIVKTDSYRVLRRLWPEVARIPDEAFIEPEQVADVALFLCSPLAAAIRGQTVVVDKGMSNAMIRGEDNRPA